MSLESICNSLDLKTTFKKAKERKILLVLQATTGRLQLERLVQLKSVSWIMLGLRLKIVLTPVPVPTHQNATLALLSKLSTREWEDKLSNFQLQLPKARLHSNLSPVELCRTIWICNLNWNIPTLAVTSKTENLDLDYSKVVRPTTFYWLRTNVTAHHLTYQTLESLEMWISNIRPILDNTISTQWDPKVFGKKRKPNTK